VAPYSPGRSGTAPRTGTLGPFHGLLHRRRLEDPVARDQLLRLGERPIDDGAVPPGELDPPALGAQEQPRQVNDDTTEPEPQGDDEIGRTSLHDAEGKMRHPSAPDHPRDLQVDRPGA
jgi:hypothetical protein